jgi:ubiquitin C-terminal hydrolase
MKKRKEIIVYFGRTIDDNYIDNQIIYPYKYTFESFIDNDIDYNLECVIEHSGGAHYGHYTSLCPIKKENKWYKFSDTSFYENHGAYHGENAIILLYKKKTN